MYLLEKLTVKGLWGNKTFACDFDPGCNFLVGKNGCGKTTIINLISAVLGLDFAAIESTDFSEITLKFGSTASRTKPELKVLKEKDPDNLYSEIKFLIRQKSTDEFREFDISETDQRILIRRKAASWRSSPNSRVSGLGIVSELRKIVNVTWLPIHRHSFPANGELTSRDFAAPIDAKINDLSNRLVRHFSALGSEVKKLEEKVQKTMFLSLLATKDSPEAGISSEMLDHEKEGLAQIFRNFRISEADYKERLDNHFKLAKESLGKISAKSSDRPSMEALSALLATFRIGYVVDAWNEFLDAQKRVLKGGSDFIEILNFLVETKTFSISATNELSVSLKNKAKAELPLFKLSSGEKQLLIILGEALLQNRSASIYIADEPELSLHVDWQEALVPNIQKLNPNAQIIFATHSPDIVGAYGSKVKDVAKLLE